MKQMILMKWIYKRGPYMYSGLTAWPLMKNDDTQQKNTHKIQIEEGI
jgi:hypothetical protein